MLVLYVVLFLFGHQAAHGSKGSKPLGEQWSDAGQFLTDFNWPHRATLVGLLKEVVQDPQKRRVLSAKCADSLDLFAKSLQTSQKWAIQMMDSMKRWSDGLPAAISGNMGDYDECLESQHVSPDLSFSGKYCLYKLILPLPEHSKKPDIIDLTGTKMEGTWFKTLADKYHFLYYMEMQSSLCFPSTCSSREIETTIKITLQKRNISLDIDMYQECDTRADFEVPFKEYPRNKQISIAILGVVTSLVGISTFLSYLFPETAPDYMKHFDAVTNTRKLFAKSKDESAKRLNFVHGIRFGYQFVAICFHVGIVTAIWTPITHVELVNFNKLGFWLLDEFTANIGSGISVNFVIGGLVAFHSWYPEMVKKNGRISFLKFFLLRWIRSTPLVFGSLLIVYAFPVSWGSGPVFRAGLSNITTTCLSRWWTEFLYISNHNDPRESCLIQAWYLSADFQLYVSSYLVIILLYKKPRVGLILAAVIVFLGIVVQGTVIVTQNTTAFMNASTLDWQKMVSEDGRLHFLAFNYVPSYFIGVILGYLICSNYIITDKKVLVIGWITACCLIGGVYYVPSLWREIGFTRTQEVIFGSTQRALLALGAAWIFYVCAIGKGGLVNELLCVKVIVPLSRFAFSIWMAHFLFLWYDVFTSRRPIDFDKFPLLMRSFYTYVAAVILGYALFISFEAPFLNLAKAAFAKNITDSDPKTSNKSSVNKKRSKKIKSY